MTSLELGQLLIRKDPVLNKKDTVVFIQCVGSRIPERPHCSKVCCTRSIKNALKLKSINPDMNIFILYRDMRAYGLREDLYREARSQGIVFIRYTIDEELNVAPNSSQLNVTFTDTVLRRQMEIHTDMVVLAAAIAPEIEDPLAKFYKVSKNTDGFFTEAHVKLRPVDFATDGVFVCGLAHSPKPLDESISQAQAAAARAVTVLSSKTRTVSGTVATVNPNLCSRCGVCVSICPYGAPKFNDRTRKAEVQATLCKGCGLCVASCRSGAISQKGFETDQIMSMIEFAAFDPAS
jgi:heterodisulfide reductase subunit A